MAIEVITLSVGPLEVNCYIIGCGVHKVCAVFDPGDSPQKILEKVEKKNWSVRQIINTHGHADHTGANAKIKEATGADIGIHKDDAELLTHPEMQGMAGYLGLGVSPEADIVFEENQVVSICPCLEFKVLSAPGHSPGGACFVFDSSVVTGDTLFNMSIGRSDLTGGDHKKLMESIRQKLLTLPDEMKVYPGHGEATTIGYERANNPFITGDSY
ncbi:MAG TPA: MBL fold metallo-hydrolase [Nitrospirae bacterium]|nr:MBL fold metallo-hydrolase [Nitrospirota bacterium]